VAQPKIPEPQEVAAALTKERDGLRFWPKTQLRRLSRILGYTSFTYRIAGDAVPGTTPDNALYNAGYRKGSIDALDSIKLTVDQILDGTFKPSQPDEEEDDNARARAEFYDE